MTTTDGAFGQFSYRNSVLGLFFTLMKQLPRPYILMLLILVHRARSITFNPVSMTDANKAKEYGFGAAALACTIVSLLASMLCMYWFCRMEKRFRHRYDILKGFMRND
jgi:Na+-driven multidrug efflux pump